MRIYYISNTIHPDDCYLMFKDKLHMLGLQAQKFNYLLMKGFNSNDVDVHAVSSLPVNRENYDKLFYGGNKSKDQKILFHYLPIINLPGIKNVMQTVGAFWHVFQAKKEDVVICDVLNASTSLGAVFAAKLKKIKCVGIVTDIPFFMLPGEMRNVRYEKIVDKVIKNCSHYVFLTEQMNSLLNPNNKSYMVVEGICDQKMEKFKPIICRTEKIKCFYAGQLNARYGLKMLVEGFIKANITDAELHLYGTGPYVPELESLCEEHKNVVYHGTVFNDVIVRAELEADLLINPRPTHEEFTKYSFPSKNLEYMASGTATLTTRLPGMPEEYLPYVYLIEEESADGIAKALEYVLGLSREEREAKGAAAKNFVLEKKSNVAQAARILDFLN